jgi:hypothetical protein
MGTQGDEIKQEWGRCEGKSGKLLENRISGRTDQLWIAFLRVCCVTGYCTKFWFGLFWAELHFGNSISVDVVECHSSCSDCSERSTSTKRTKLK